MPGPPTPLSGCPLKRLEIHDRLADRAYDAAQTAAALTLTLEAQRSSSQDSNDFVLQVHCGLQRMLSFQLTGLLNSANGKGDAVSIERAFKQLCVNSHQHDQKLVATFEEARDFNVAACMLKKFGFQVKEGIPKPNAPSIYNTPTPAHGPRLSSITPLPWPGPIGQSQSGPDLTFASMLNPEIPLSHSGQVHNHISTASSPSPISSPMHAHFGPSVPPLFTPPPYEYAVPQTMSQPAYNSFLNPYHVFLGRQLTHPHQPLVGSPLRNSFDVREAGVPMTSFEHPAYPGQSRFRLLQDGRSISAPIISQQNQESQGSQGSQGYENLGGFPQLREPDLISQAASQPSNPGELSQRSDGSTTLNQLQSEMKQDIHELMPKPRELPFAKQGKAAVGPKKALKPGPTSKTIAKEKPKKQLKAQPKNAAKVAPKKLRGRLEENHQSEPKEAPKGKPKGKSIVKPKESPLQSEEAKPVQKRVRKPRTPWEQEAEPGGRKRTREEIVESIEVDKSTKKPAPKSARRTKAPPPHRPLETPPSHDNASPKASSPFESPARVSTMLLTDHDVLRKVNEATSKLLQQYEVDIARGCEDGACAKFYAERIHAARRDFWLAQLMGEDNGRHFTLMPQASVIAF